MSDDKIFQFLRRVFIFISNNPFFFCLILGASYFLFRLASNGFLYGADTSNKVAGIFTPLIVAVVTIYLSRRQHNIADSQRAVAEESKNIAAANRDIAERKLKLELFDKRYDVYQKFTKTYLEYTRYFDLIRAVNEKKLHNKNTSLFKTNETYEKYKLIRKNYFEIWDEMFMEVEKIKFLFDIPTYDICFCLLQSIEKFIDSVSVYSCDDYHIIKSNEYIKYDDEIVNVFKESKKKLDPYMALNF